MARDYLGSRGGALEHARSQPNPNYTDTIIMEEEPTVSLRVASEQQPESGMSMEKMWAEAAEAFEKICGESLRRGEVKNFDDVQRKIEDACKARSDVGQEDKWERAKSVGLQSLKYLQMLVGVASKASSLVR